MVGEFPELQGIMGYYYAINESMGEKTAEAIRDHYKPLGPSDEVPRGNAAILALADKIDSLVGLMLAGEAPTGSSDPFALRRLAFGIIRIILENKISLSLKELIHFAIEKFIDQGLEFEKAILYHRDVILSFLEDRVSHHLKNEYNISLVNATLDLKFEDNILITYEKLIAFRKFFNTKSGIDLVTIYKRINNLLGENLYTGYINRDYLIVDEEKELFEALLAKSPKVEAAIVARNFEEVLSRLSELILNISKFFDNVLVKNDDPLISNNRLLLLQEVKTLFETIAKFDKL
jgi:glycyl-tRNA synthetase beta chain